MGRTIIEGTRGARTLVDSLGRADAITRARRAIAAANRDGNEAAVNRWVDVLNIITLA